MIRGYEQAFYWFLMEPFVVRITVGTAVVIAIAVSLLLILRKWGEYA